MSIPRIGTVLCPVDLSEQSRAALCLATGFAQTPGSRLAVLRVDPRLSPSADGSDLAARTELDEFVRKALPGVLADNDNNDLIVRGGEAPSAILSTARDIDADLIVMGTRGRGALVRALLGSTAAAVLQGTTLPVMVVPPAMPELISLGKDHAEFHFGLILVPVDLKGAASKQLDWAGRLSAGSSHKLLLVHVVPPGSDREFAIERMNQMAKGMASARGVKLLVREGQVVDEVIHVVQHERVGVVIMGRGSDAPGAIAYEVLRNSRALVLMVP
jgi:universal stress protein A